VSSDSKVDGDWLPATLTSLSVLTAVLSTRIRRHRKFEVSRTECTCQGNDFKLIPMVKTETRNPDEGYSL